MRNAGMLYSKRMSPTKTKKPKARKRTKGVRPPFPLDQIDHAMLNHMVVNPSYTAVEIGSLVGLKSRAVKMRWVRLEFREALTELSKPARDVLERIATEGALELHKQISYQVEPFKKVEELTADDLLQMRRLEIRAARIRQGASLGVVRTVIGDKTVHEGEINTNIGMTPEQIKEIAASLVRETRKGKNG